MFGRLAGYEDVNDAYRLAHDPAMRAVVDRTGKLVDHATIYPHEPKRQWDQSLHVLRALCAKHAVELIAIGNGTASRESDKLVAELVNSTQCCCIPRNTAAGISTAVNRVNHNH